MCVHGARTRKHPYSGGHHVNSLSIPFSAGIHPIGAARRYRHRGGAGGTIGASNLHQIGIAFETRRGTGERRFPDAAQLPSLTPGKPSIVQVLGPYVENNSAFFHCPSDSDYFASEGTSYEYYTRNVGLAPEDLINKKRRLDLTWVLYDYDCFHGVPGTPGCRNFLYADGHVGD
jgi:prepilin-type processing-associated H-X9-DG protein